ncbi:hypothetical protein SAMN02745704_01882 [Paucidesulfovibrio gracilis DSM 16080]|uniref:Uncharacterized protein n=1 Tax=Paucidesulfovibrio gracilis DSM 16080 TaxID=1121449 RepID=A0A1T4X8V3_9BACT|nr:hypothetical protein [Paucidesulfovibrio gracilis]SKA85538.1 hypothetical protein SAMN02745704_01882 [Paucidesulfovibrio gracilis DSM 16080]
MSGASWQLDRRINLATLVSLGSCLLMALAAGAGLGARLQVMEEKLCTLEERVHETRRTAVKVERIEERVAGIQEMLVDIRSELRRRRG